MNKPLQVLSYDVGGSHATVGIVDSESLAISYLNSCAIDSDGTADSILDELFVLGITAVDRLPGLSQKPNGLAVAVPGPFIYESGISLLRHKFASLYKMDVRRELAERFGINEDTVAFLNDAQAFLLGENYAGGTRAASRSVGLTLGTGVGSAFSIGGRLVEDRAGVPHGGEIYCLPWNEQTVEDEISTRAIQNRFTEITGEKTSVRDICLAAQQDPAAKLVLYEFGRNLGMVIERYCMPFQPDKIVIGGGISRSADLFLPAVNKSVGDGTHHLLTISELSSEAPLIGAAIRCLEMISGTTLPGKFRSCELHDKPAARHPLYVEEKRSGLLSFDFGSGCGATPPNCTRWEIADVFKIRIDRFWCKYMHGAQQGRWRGKDYAASTAFQIAGAMWLLRRSRPRANCSL